MPNTVKADSVLDAKGLCCPMPTVKTALALDKLKVGEVLEVIADDPTSRRDLPRWVETTGHQLVSVVEEGEKLTRVFIKKTH